MIGTMIGLITLLGTIVLGIGGYFLARDFVRKKLRFVDAVRSPLAPIAAGIGAFLVLWPLSWLPLISATPAVVFAFGCAFGTASGVKALRRYDAGSRPLLR
jgi:O-antigen/teichoic acid export membrane protein